MNIEKLQNQIKKLPEEEKQVIKKIRELDDKEMEEAVGGLSSTAKNILIALGALGATAAIGGTGAYLGRELGLKEGYQEGYQEGHSLGIQKVREAFKAGKKIGPGAKISRES